MRLLLILLLSVMLASAAHGTIVRVESASGSTVASTTTSHIGISVSALTAGNYLAVFITGGAPKQIITTPVASTDITVVAGQSVYDITGVVTSVFRLYKINTGGATSVDVGTQDTVAQSFSVVLIEYSGKNITSDVWATANGTGTALASGTTATTGYANELQLAVFGQRGSFASAQTAWASSPTNSFVSVLQTSTSVNTSNTDRQIAVFELLGAAVGTASTAITSGTSNRYANLIVTLREIPQVSVNTHND